MKIYILFVLQLLVMVCLLINTNLNRRKILDRPTYEEIVVYTKYIADSIVKADTPSIFDRKVADRLRSLLIVLVEIQQGKPYMWKLAKHLMWLGNFEEERSKEAHRVFMEKVRRQHLKRSQN